MLEKRTRHDTGEVCYVLRKHDPPERFGAREKHGVHGRPFLTLWVFADRVELERGWCFASGHMEAYEQEIEATYRREGDRWPDALAGAVVDWFGNSAANEVFERLSDSTAFQ